MSNLLLVDGDAQNLRVLEVSLRKAGYQVTCAENGKEALEQLGSARPRLIISDTQLPDMTGFALCEQLKADPQYAECPFIFLSSQRNIEDKIRGLQLGVEDYLSKPIFVKEILGRIEMLLQRQQRERFAFHDGESVYHGNLADMGVVDLIQAMELGRKSGIATFMSQDSRVGTLFFRNGQIIDAELGLLMGEKAIYSLLGWGDGTFEVEFGNLQRQDVIGRSNQALVVEGMRTVNELSEVLEDLPSLDAVVEVNYQELGPRLAEIPDDKNRVLRLINGHNPLRKIIEATDCGDLEAMTFIRDLFVANLIFEVDSSGRRRISQRDAAPRPAPGAAEDSPEAEFSGDTDRMQLMANPRTAEISTTLMGEAQVSQAGQGALWESEELNPEELGGAPTVDEPVPRPASVQTFDEPPPPDEFDEVPGHYDAEGEEAGSAAPPDPAPPPRDDEAQERAAAAAEAAEAQEGGSPWINTPTQVDIEGTESELSPSAEDRSRRKAGTRPATPVPPAVELAVPPPGGQWARQPAPAAAEPQPPPAAAAVAPDLTPLAGGGDNRAAPPVTVPPQEAEGEVLLLKKKSAGPEPDPSRPQEASTPPERITSRYGSPAPAAGGTDRAPTDPAGDDLAVAGGGGGAPLPGGEDKKEVEERELDDWLNAMNEQDAEKALKPARRSSVATERGQVLPFRRAEAQEGSEDESLADTWPEARRKLRGSSPADTARPSVMLQEAELAAAQRQEPADPQDPLPAASPPQARAAELSGQPPTPEAGAAPAQPVAAPATPAAGPAPAAPRALEKDTSNVSLTDSDQAFFDAELGEGREESFDSLHMSSDIMPYSRRGMWLAVGLLAVGLVGGGVALYAYLSSPYVGDGPAELSINRAAVRKAQEDGARAREQEQERQAQEQESFAGTGRYRPARAPAEAPAVASDEAPAAPASDEAPAAPASDEAPAAPASDEAPAAPGSAPAPAAPGSAPAPAAPGSAPAPAGAGDYPALLQEGQRLLKARKKREAYKVLSRAAELNPRGWEALEQLALHNMEGGRMSAAYKQARQAEQANPDAPFAQLVIGATLHEQGKKAAARTAYLKFLKLCPGCRYVSDIKAVLRSM